MSTSPEPLSIKLPAYLDRTNLSALKQELDEHQGDNIILDGTDVESLSGLGLQLIHLAQTHWTESGLSLELRNAPELLSTALEWIQTDPAPLNGDTETCL